MDCFNFQYAVKFVCGIVDRPQDPTPDQRVVDQPVAHGEYFTAINIHNPTDSIVPFRYKVAVALPLGPPSPLPPTPRPVSNFRDDVTLGDDEAVEIDCDEINRIIGEIPYEAKFVKGFVVIESDVEFDVVAVYTAAGRDEQVVSIHMERVAARRPIRLPQQL